MKYGWQGGLILEIIMKNFTLFMMANHLKGYPGNNEIF